MRSISELEAKREVPRLSRAGVPVECHLYPAVPHSFELFAPGSAVAEQVLADRARVLRAL